jgi:hypothetical protein
MMETIKKFQTCNFKVFHAKTINVLKHKLFWKFKKSKLILKKRKLINKKNRVNNKADYQEVFKFKFR